MSFLFGRCTPPNRRITHEDSFEDRLIDTADLIKKLRGLVKTHNANVDENLQQLAKDEITLNQERAKTSLQDDDKFLVVGKVAKLVGVEGTFYGVNGVLSKLAHPTALSLLLALPPVEEQKIRTFMLRSGLIFAKDVLDIIAEYFRAEGVDTVLIEDPEFLYPPTFRRPNAPHLPQLPPYLHKFTSPMEQRYWQRSFRMRPANPPMGFMAAAEPASSTFR